MSNIEIILICLAGAALGGVTVPLAIRLAYRYDMLDPPGAHKRHKTPMPVVGGLAMFLSVWIVVGAVLLIFPEFAAELGQSLLFIFLGALIITLVGLSDDLTPVSAWVKLAAQISAGIVVYLGGLQVSLLSSPSGSIELGSISLVISVLWVVGLTNAINLIDGLDGLAAGVSLIGGLTMLIIGLLYEVGPVLVFIGSLVGFLAVFLIFNRYPAKIFLGDSGSMQIGYYFAVFSLIIPVKSYTASALYLPLIALGVPILEAGSSLVRRLISGKGIMTADRRHLFHYLSLAGLSPRQVVNVFYLLAIVFGGFALAMYYFNRLILFGLLVVFMVVIFVGFLILISNLSGGRPFKRVGRGQKN